MHKLFRLYKKVYCLFQISPLTCTQCSSALQRYSGTVVQWRGWVWQGFMVVSFIRLNCARLSHLPRTIWVIVELLIRRVTPVIDCSCHSHWAAWSE